MSKRPAKLFFDDICDAIQKIERYTCGMPRKTFIRDEKSVDAVVRNLEIIGEAVSRLPREVKDRRPDVDWKKIIGLRHRIVHDYFGIDLDIVWHILQSDLPQFKKIVETLMMELQAGNE